MNFFLSPVSKLDRGLQPWCQRHDGLAVLGKGDLVSASSCTSSKTWGKTVASDGRKDDQRVLTYLFLSLYCLSLILCELQNLE